MQTPEFVYTLEGHPYHAAQTRIYWERNTLMQDCPHCGVAHVPLHMVADLGRYADKCVAN